MKANTPGAFDYFWRRRDYVNRWYLEPSRLNFYEEVAAICESLLANRSSPRILDVGCGTGHFLQTLQQRIETKTTPELHGIDFSRVAIRQARKLLPHAYFSVQDIYRHKLETGSFDLVICMEALEHLKEPDLALRQLLALTHPEGQLVLTVPNGEFDQWDGHVNFWTPQTLRRWLEPMGLCEVQMLGGEQTILARLMPPHAAIATLAA